MYGGAVRSRIVLKVECLLERSGNENFLQIYPAKEYDKNEIQVKEQ